MNRQTLARLGRRALVLAATGGVLAVAVVTVQLAAAWRADIAPLDAQPVSVSSLDASAVAESDRTKELTGQVEDLAKQLDDLTAAVSAAGGSVEGDLANAAELQAQMDAATAKLTTLQGQLKTAQARLKALNAAASKQAALNRAARAAAPSGGGSAGGGEREDDDDDD